MNYKTTNARGTPWRARFGVVLIATGLVFAPLASAVEVNGYAWEDINADGQRGASEPTESETVIAYLCQPPWGQAGISEADEETGAFSFDLTPAWYQFGTSSDDELTHLFVGDPATDNDFWPNGFTSCYDYSQTQPDLGLGFAAEEEGEIEVAEVFFELNDTDGDLGLQGLIDNDGWVTLEISDNDDVSMLDLEVSGALAEQGMTEFFFESSEPNFSELPPAEFFQRFPEGVYDIELENADGDEFEAEFELSHVMPAPPGNLRVANLAAASSCDGVLPRVDGNAPIIVRWDAVTGSHPELGGSGDVQVRNYEFVIEIEDEAADRTHSLHVLLPAEAREFEVPASLIALSPDGEIKFEVGVQAEETLNRTVSESCFIAE